MSSADSLSKPHQTSESLADEYIPGEFVEESTPSTFQEFTSEETSDCPVTAPPVLIMAAPPPARAKFGTPFWLAHTLGLDVYGTSTLSYAARIEMITAALVLTIIFLFDVGAWCLLFYFILNSGSLEFHPGMLVLSLAGVLPALSLLLYERSFMTADTKTHGWGRLLLPTVLRICVIFGAAWMTAQPVELMAFRRRIERRVQDELIRKDIVGHVQKLKKAEADQGNGYITLVERHTTQLNHTEAELKDKKEKLTVAEFELERRKQAQSAAAIRLQEAKSHLKDAQASAAATPDSPEKKYTAAEKKKAVDLAEGKLSDQAKRVAEQQGVVAVLKQSAVNLGQDITGFEAMLDKDKKAKAGEETEDKLLAWADKLRRVQPGEDYPPGPEDDPQTGFKFKFLDYSFLDKFRIIDDMLNGRSARWPGIDTKTMESLKQTYGLYDDYDNATDPQARERIAAETSNARRAYCAVFGVALIIPFMSLLFKIIMPAQLSYYYSSKWQSQQGHPEAIAFEAAIYSMRDHSSRAREEPSRKARARPA